MLIITATAGLMPRSSLAGASLAGLPSRPVPPLVVADRIQAVLAAACPPLQLLPFLAHLVPATAHLLHRQLRVFPPAAAPCVRQQTSASTGTTFGAAAGPCSSCPHSA